MTEYRTIPGYDGYRFGDDGSVWSRWGKNGGLTDQWHQLRGTPSTHYGHIKVEVKYKGRRGIRAVHRLILEAFIGPCPPGMVSCHGPGGKTDNRLCNLRWDTQKANLGDRVRDGTHLFGERSGVAKYTERQAARVIQLRKSGATYAEIERETGVPWHSIHKITKGKQWKHLHNGDRWMQVLAESA